MTVKILSIVFFIIFGLFAILQLNDPDPILWTTVYTSVSLASFLRFFDIHRKRAFLLLTVLLTSMACFYVPGFIEYLWQPNKGEIVGDMVYEKPYIEETREFVGLLMAAGAMYYHYKSA